MSEFDAPRDGLIRANFETRAQVSDGRTMTGYPVVFDQWTEIKGWEGNFKERIAPGALNRTLKNNRDQIKVLFNHGMDPQIGDKPLGKPSVMRADAQGLYVEVPLTETSYNEDIRALIADGTLDGMSFRFSVVDETWDEPVKKGALPERTITELRLFELGPVTFPAYQATSVGVRSREQFTEWMGLDDTRRAQIEQIMRGTATFSDVPAIGTTFAELGSNDIAGPEGDHPAVDPILRFRQLSAKARYMELTT